MYYSMRSWTEAAQELVRASPHTARMTVKTEARSGAVIAKITDNSKVLTIKAVFGSEIAGVQAMQLWMLQECARPIDTSSEAAGAAAAAAAAATEPGTKRPFPSGSGAARRRSLRAAGKIVSKRARKAAAGQAGGATGAAARRAHQE